MVVRPLNVFLALSILGATYALLGRRWGLQDHQDWRNGAGLLVCAALALIGYDTWRARAIAVAAVVVVIGVVCARFELAKWRCDAGDNVACVCHGDASRCFALAEKTKSDSGGPADRKAAALYQVACDAGNAPGCRELAGMYQLGIRLSKDEIRARVLYEKAASLDAQACDADDWGACNALGLLYLNGQGLTKSDAKALQLFERVCNHERANDDDVATACTDIGWMYETGTGTARNDEKAVALYTKACAHQPGLCSSLGEMTADGRGSAEPDQRKAVALFKQSCDAQNRVGCADLGFMHERGISVPVDAMKAAELYQQGCNDNNPWACERLKRLEASSRN